MGALAKRVYVISDLHMGGHRGCRLFYQGEALATFVRELAGQAAKAEHEVELVINGDFVDFLAVPVGVKVDGRWTWPKDVAPEDMTFSAFRRDPVEAEAVLRKIVSEERHVFLALRRLLRSGGRLTLLLGNHDLELSFPNVRARLERVLKADGKRYRFLYDGEAYVVGDVLIEHGNRCDGDNDFCYGGLRLFRAHLSRDIEPPEFSFVPPFGSELVAKVIAPMSLSPSTSFVAKMKPETSMAHLRLLWALADGPFRRASRLGLTWMSARVRRLMQFMESALNEADMADGDDEPPQMMRLEEYALSDLSEEERRSFLDELVSSELREAAMSAGDEEPAPKSRWKGTRLRGLLWLVRRLSRSPAFDEEQEGNKGFRSGFAELFGRKYTDAGIHEHGTVVLGHSHLTKNLAVLGGHYYNTGTWADLLRFPTEIVDEADDDLARKRLKAFVSALESGDYVPERHRPFVRIEIDHDGAVTHSLETWSTNADA